jgi:hypothetical protein
MRGQDIVDILDAYSSNTDLPAQKMHTDIDVYYKKQLLSKWDAEIRHFQAYLIRANDSLFKLKYYDEEIWNKIVSDIVAKKRLHNVHYFHTCYHNFTELNKSKVMPNIDFESAIESLLKMFEKRDYRLQYNLKEMRLKTYDEKRAEADTITMDELEKLQVYKDYETLAFRKIHLHENITAPVVVIKPKKPKAKKRIPKIKTPFKKKLK